MSDFYLAPYSFTESDKGTVINARLTATNGVSFTTYLISG